MAEGAMRTNRITTIGEYVEALHDCTRVIVQVNRPGLPIPPGKFFAFNPRNLSDNERMILDAIKDCEVEEFQFNDPVLNV